MSPGCRWVAVLAILPWNFPVWQGFRCATSALMAGNVLLLKHAPNVQGCASLVTELFASAGFPAGVFQNLHADIAGHRSHHRRPARRGGHAHRQPGGRREGGCAGRRGLQEIHHGAGRRRSLHRAGRCRPRCRGGRSGARAFLELRPVCLAAKRFIVEAGVAAEFTEAFAAAAAALRIGDPLEAGTQLGPMARADLRENSWKHRSTPRLPAAQSW